MKRFLAFLTAILMVTIPLIAPLNVSAETLPVFPSPDSFTPADSLRVFGTAENPAKDGTIFDYMNGGGLVYLDHGLETMHHWVFKNASGQTITVDIFTMDSPENAQAAFADETICPQDPLACDVGAPCKAYHYPPDYFLYSVKAQYLVYVGTTHDSLVSTVDRYAAALVTILTGE